MSRMSGSRNASCVLLSPLSATGASPDMGVHLPAIKPAPLGRVSGAPCRTAATRRGTTILCVRSAILQRRAPQLSAGGVNLGSLAFADFDADPLLLEGRHEGG